MLKIILCLSLVFLDCHYSFQSTGLLSIIKSNVLKKYQQPINFKLKISSSETNPDVTVNSSETKLVTTQDKISAWFSPNTRGGILVLCGLLTLIPLAVYKVLIANGFEESTVGAYVGALFVLLSNLLWASTYIFRVATKDMTYAKQLRDYENAVLQKRLEELADDEINALLEEIELEEKQTTPQDSNIITKI